jgi:hypothetical protein
MPLEYAAGDLLNAREDVLVHQANCVSQGARGLAAALFARCAGACRRGCLAGRRRFPAGRVLPRRRAPMAPLSRPLHAAGSPGLTSTRGAAAAAASGTRRAPSRCAATPAAASGARQTCLVSPGLPRSRGAPHAPLRTAARRAPVFLVAPQPTLRALACGLECAARHVLGTLAWADSRLVVSSSLKHALPNLRRTNPRPGRVRQAPGVLQIRPAAAGRPGGRPLLRLPPGHRLRPRGRRVARL